jgi:hypothetical protein
MAIKKETSQELTFQEKLSNIQFELKSPKSQYNAFGKYKYRNQEDILESVKPLLNQNKLCMSISDDIVEVGGRIYVKATVRIYNETYEEITTAFAREEENKKGMDSAQLTGATSSYARKYALNGMFLIDDTKDSDATNTHGKELEKPSAPVAKPPKTTISDVNKVILALGSNREGTINQLKTSYVITASQAKELGLTQEEMALIEIK